MLFRSRSATSAEYTRAGGLSDSTINPSKVWFAGKGQSIVNAPGGWCAQSDLAVPKLPAEANYKERYDALCAEMIALAAKYKEK